MPELPSVESHIMIAINSAIGVRHSYDWYQALNSLAQVEIREGLKGEFTIFILGSISHVSQVTRMKVSLTFRREFSEP